MNYMNIFFQLMNKVEKKLWRMQLEKIKNLKKKNY